MTSPDPDLPLLQRARAGDFSAFEGLVDRHERRLYGIAMGILRQREDAENVVQTAFLKVLESLDRFRGESTFATWVSRIATHAALNALRKRKGLPTVSLDVGDDEDGEIRHPRQLADWRGDPARVVERRELRRILDDAIQTLPEKHRLVFVLRDVEGLSVRETAQALSISEANVKVRLLRARLALREKLAGTFGDGSGAEPAGHAHGDGERDSTPARDLLRSYEEGRP